MKRLIAFAFAWFLAAAVGAAEIRQGKEYTLVSPPQPSSTPGKIEVIEFFSYGCPHCADFHPLLSRWAANLPADVTLRRVPVSFNRAPWARLSKLYFALENTGMLAKYDQEVFRALHEQRMNFATDESVVQWVGGKGGNAKAFGEAFNGFSIGSQVARADKESAAHKIPGVPALVVDGRYLVNNAEATGYEHLLQITDALIAKARAEKGKK